MNMVRTFAWAALLVGSGAPSTLPPRPGLPASSPANAPAPQTPAPQVPAHQIPARQDQSQVESTWPLDLDDDEFEGEGWSFWPLAQPRR